MLPALILVLILVYSGLILVYSGSYAACSYFLDISDESTSRQQHLNAYMMNMK